MDLGVGRDPAFRYVLVVVELYTRYIWMFPVPTKHALLVGRHVSGWCQPPSRLRGVAQGRSHTRLAGPSHGTDSCHPATPCCHVSQLYSLWATTPRPAVLQCDNGSEFKAQVAQVADLFGIRIINSSVGNPQAQGAVERTNRSFKDMVRALLLKCPTIHWSFQASLHGGAPALAWAQASSRTTQHACMPLQPPRPVCMPLCTVAAAAACPARSHALPACPCAQWQQLQHAAGACMQAVAACSMPLCTVAALTCSPTAFAPLLQLYRIADQINQQPCEAYNNEMSRSEALFGVRAMRTVHPPPEVAAAVLQLNRCAATATAAC